MFAKNNYFVVLLKIFVILWISLSVLRMFYNFSKLFTEETKWYGLTDEKKREKQFGDKHNFFRFIQSKIPAKSNILLYTDDGMVYYLARYYLYPTTVIWGERQFTEWKNDINRRYEYVVYYPTDQTKIKKSVIVNGELYQFVEIFKGEKVGSVYKK